MGRTVYLLTYYGTFLTSIMNDSNCWIWSVSHLEDLLFPVVSKGREEVLLTKKYKGLSFSNKSKFMYIVNSEFCKVGHIQSMSGKKNHSALPLSLSPLLFNIQIYQHLHHYHHHHHDQQQQPKFISEPVQQFREKPISGESYIYWYGWAKGFHIE